MHLSRSFKVTSLCKVRRSKCIQGCKMSGCGTSIQGLLLTILQITIITINKLIPSCSAKKSLKKKLVKLMLLSPTVKRFRDLEAQAYHKRKPSLFRQQNRCEVSLLLSSNLMLAKNKLNMILLKLNKLWSLSKKILQTPKREPCILFHIPIPIWGG